MRFKRIFAVLMAAVISAGTCAVPAFAFTDEAVETAVVQDAAPAENSEEETKADEAAEAEATTSESEDDSSLSKILADSELLAMILPELDEETIDFLIAHPKLVAAFIPTLHVTLTDHSLIVTVDELEEAAQTGTVTTNGSCLNVRNGASTDYDIIGQLSNGAGVTIKGEKDGWYQIEFPAEFAYVCGQYIRLNDIPTKETVEGTTFDIDGRKILTFLKALEAYFPDTPVVAESHGLTPSGNLTLVDDIGSSTGEGQQFVTMVTRAGNYYYLVIDRDEKGNENVHFLNQVDEADLFNLMDEDAAETMKEQLAAEEAARQAAQTPSVTTPTEPQETTEPEPEQEQKKSAAPLAMALVVLIVLGGVGGFFFMKNKKQKEAVADRPDPDADYREDDDGYDIPEEADEEEYDESEEA